MDKSISKTINTALEKELPDIVFKNAKIVDVFSLEIMEGDIAVLDDMIIGIGEYHTAKEIIDLKGKFVSPGLIEAHVHIESSLIIPENFSTVLLKHGVTTAVIDPHEIANVMGKEGIRYMIDSTENTELDIFIMLPSCVPSTPHESSGAVLNSRDLKEFYSNPRVLGLGELMNYPGLLGLDNDLIQKIYDAKSLNLSIDGHAPSISPKELNAYVSAGITTDHECETYEEMKLRLQRGMYIFIREGTAARNLEALIKHVNYKNNDLISFCTDDKEIIDMEKEGSIDYCVRKAVNFGLDPLLAIKMGSYNAAKAHNFHDRGAIAPGKKADLVILDNLENFSIISVYKNGRLIDEKPKTEFLKIKEHKLCVSDNINWDIKLKSPEIRAVGIVPNNLFTNEYIMKADIDQNGNFIPDAGKDAVKLFVIERHNPDNNNVGRGILHGLRIKKGVIATTIGHDSHNLIMAGYDGNDFSLALKTLKELNGGITVVSDGKVLAVLPLEVAGLMTSKPVSEVLDKLEQLNSALDEIGFDGEFSPFLSLSFLSLPVIPKLKITDMGLFDVEKFGFVDIEI
jgi:adenine deaminase